MILNGLDRPGSRATVVKSQIEPGRERPTGGSRSPSSVDGKSLITLSLLATRHNDKKKGVVGQKTPPRHRQIRNRRKGWYHLSEPTGDIRNPDGTKQRPVARSKQHGRSGNESGPAGHPPGRTTDRYPGRSAAGCKSGCEAEEIDLHQEAMGKA